MRLVIVCDGADHTARLLADAATAGGHSVQLHDLRHVSWSMRTGRHGVVWCDGAPVDADLVINRTTASAAGRVSEAALRRQHGATWFEQFAAAREEQGLVLAALDRLGRDGAEVVDPVTTFDLASMPQLVVERLAALATPPASSDGPVETYAVVRGRVVLCPGQSAPADSVLRQCRRVAAAAEFSLGEVDIEIASQRPSAWRSRLSLDHRPVAEARAIASGAIEVLTGERPPPAATTAPFLFVPDLVDHLLHPPQPR